MIMLYWRLDNAEDRDRRENLAFYGISDAATEHAQQSVQKVLDTIDNLLKTAVSGEIISLAQRIGRYDQSMPRPLIAKFTNSKIKELILSKSHMLKGSNIGIREDFFPTTRNLRKKFFEFGKNLKKPFKLRHKSLVVDEKCYQYNAVDDSVYEVIPSMSAVLL